MQEKASHQPRSLLFVLWDGGGNIPPQLALARRLSERGHRVRVLAPRVLRSRIEAAGCTFVPLRETPEHDSSTQADDLLRDWEERISLKAAIRVRDRLIFGTARTYNQDVSAAIMDERPDLVLTDYLLLGAYVAAEHARIPLVALVHTIYPLPAPGLPPYGMGFQPARGTPGHIRDVIFTQVFRRFYNAPLARLNQVRLAAGLPALTSVFEQFWGADRLLVLTSPAFDFPASALPPNVRYVGPQLDDPAWLAPWEPPLATENTGDTGDTDGRPLVLVSLSTTYQGQADVLRRIIAALADLPVRGLVTLGPALSQRDFTLPPNVRAEPYVPHVQVCPHADLVVTHGGHGTVITALTFGVPVVCVPMGRDQADNAARVVWRDAGTRCAQTASVERLRSAIRRVLEEPRFRAGARRIAAEIAGQGGAFRSVEEVESLAESRAESVV